MVGICGCLISLFILWIVWVRGERIVMILYFLLLLRLGVWLADDDMEKTYIERQLL